MTSDQDPNQFRKYLRQPLAVEFLVRGQGEAKSAALLFDTVDLSVGGAFLKSDLLLEEGEELIVSFTLPGHMTAIHATAKVAWATPRTNIRGATGMGIAFTNLNAEGRAAIASYIDITRKKQLTEDEK